MSNILVRIKKIKNKEYIILSLIILLAFIVRLYKIDNPIADWHSWRQADTSSVGRIYVQEGINLLYPRYYDISTIQSGIFNPKGYRFVEFPIYNAVHSLIYTTFPIVSFEIWGRLLSIACSLISTYLLFLIGFRYLGKLGGVLASFIFAFMPFNIYYSRAILPEPMAVMFVLFSLWFFVQYYDSDNTKKLYLLSLFFSAAILIKPYVFFYSIPMIFVLLKRDGIVKILLQKKYYLAFLIVVVPFFLWRFWINQFPEGIPFYSWAFNGNGIRFKPSFWYWIFTERIGKLLLGGWGLIVLGFALIDKNKEKYFIHLIFYSAIFYVTLIANANVLHDYYQVLIVPALSLSLAYGIYVMWNIQNFNQRISRLLCLFSVFVMLTSGAVQVKEYYKVNHWEITRAGKFVDENTPDDALVIAPYNGDTAFLYQTNRFGWPYLDRSIEEEIEKGADYYVSVSYDEQTKKLMEKFPVIEENKEFVVIKLH